MLALDGPRLFCLCLAATNFAALNSWRVQWRALVSSKGLTPAAALVASWSESKTATPFPWNALSSLHPRLLWAWVLELWDKYDRHRSLFAFLGASDASLEWVFALGFAGIALIASGHGLLPGVGALMYYLSYTSHHAVAKQWLRLQMDTALPECNLIFAALYLLSWASPSAWILCQRFLVFRVMLGCGVAKWTGGDVTWRNIFKSGRKSAMEYHHWTQPLPGPLARWVHWRSPFYHSLETLMTFVLEIGLPLFYFAPSPTIRQLASFLTFGFNAGIALTGNFGHLHLLTSTEAFAVAIEMGCTASSKAADLNQAPHASAASAVFPLALFTNPCPAAGGIAYTLLQWAFALVAWALALAYVVLSLPPLCRTFEGLVELHEPVPGWREVERWSSRLSRFELFHYASKFTHMTKTRWEIVIEVAIKKLASPNERVWWQLETNVKPGGGTASLSRLPPQLNVLWHARDLFEWHQFFLTNAINRCLSRGLPLAVVGESWYIEGLRQLLLGNPVVWGQLVKLPKGLQEELLTAASSSSSSSSAAAGTTIQDALKKRVVAVRASVYTYEFTPLSTPPLPSQAAQATGDSASAAADAAPSARLQAASSPARAKRGSSPAPVKVHRPPSAAIAAGSAASAVSSAPPAPTSLDVSNADKGSWSVDGVFPASEAGSVWTRKRCCTFALCFKKGLKLTVPEIRGFSPASGGNIFPHAEPIVIVEDTGSAANEARRGEGGAEAENDESDEDRTDAALDDADDDDDDDDDASEGEPSENDDDNDD